MIRIAICDDEAIFLDQVKTLLEKYAKESKLPMVVNPEYYSSPEWLRDSILDGEHFDVFLLDIEMPNLDGISLSQFIRRHFPESIIIFLTSHTDFSFIQAGFKVSALRYISKFDIQDALLEALNEAASLLQVNSTKHLVLSHYNDTVRIPYNNIIYVQRVMRYLEITVIDQPEPYRSSYGLRDLFSKLNDPRFVYIERSCFVNLDYVTRLTSSVIHLKSGETLPISRKLLPKLKSTILKLWGGHE